MHVHNGAWFTTWQIALLPQLPGHGSTHLLFKHAVFEGQSVLTTHSGLHPSYGLPVYPSKHMQEPALFRSLHSALTPHGDGEHGLVIISVCIGSWMHRKNGSPVNPWGQRQFGECLTTLHSAFAAHAPSQGFVHLLLTHDRCDEHSPLIEHSGRQ